MTSRYLVVGGLVLSIIATIFLYIGSKHLPWGLQSIGGITDREKAYFRARKTYSTWGFVLLALGFLLQMIGVIIQ